MNLLRRVIAEAKFSISKALAGSKGDCTRQFRATILKRERDFFGFSGCENQDDVHLVMNYEKQTAD